MSAFYNKKFKSSCDAVKPGVKTSLHEKSGGGRNARRLKLNPTPVKALAA
jgi:hypothetical protein